MGGLANKDTALYNVTCPTGVTLPGIKLLPALFSGSLELTNLATHQGAAPEESSCSRYKTQGHYEAQVVYACFTVCILHVLQ